MTKLQKEKLKEIKNQTSIVDEDFDELSQSSREALDKIDEIVDELINE